MDSTSAEEIDRMICKARETFKTGRTISVEFRRSQLKQLLRLVNENENIIIDAIRKDMKKARFEAVLSDTDLSRNEILHLIHNLDSYTSKQPSSKSLVTLFDEPYTYYEPYGVVFIIGAWNYPVVLILNPLAGAIAAGNTAIMKPSELSPETSKLLARLVPRYLDSTAYFVATGGADVCQTILSYKLDFVFYTGSNVIGQKIYEAAAKHLTPVCLELGGKSPVFIDSKTLSPTDMRIAVKRILWCKYFNAGQTCIAADYVLCDAETKKVFLSHVPSIWKKFTASAAKDMAHILNQRHFDRLSNLLLNTKGVILKGANVGAFQDNDRNDLFFNLHIITNVDAEDEVMKEEIFGPILPIVEVKDHVEAIRFINDMRDKPLTMYIFSKNKHAIHDFVSKTSSGSICVNDTMVMMVHNGLPFGSVGLGSYHGFHTFKCFSHEKSILHRGYNSILEWVASKRYPPYSNNHLVRMQRLIRQRKYLNVKWLEKISLPVVSAFVAGLIYGYTLHY